MGLSESAGLLWLIAAAVLAGGELVVPGVFLIFLAIAAAATGIAIFVLPELTLVAQLASFAVWAAATVAIGQRWYRDYPVASSDPLLNDRAARLVGEIVIVDAAIVEGYGRVRVGDGVWPARGSDAPIGTPLRVLGVVDGTLTVEALQRIEVTP